MSPLTRRDFVKVAALAGAGASIESCSFRPARPPSDAIILGAGMAGMAAARDLVRSGLDVLVIEARDRVGGRMETNTEQSPHGLEVGAQMVHGSRAPTWELIRELGIETRPLRDWPHWQWTQAGGFRQRSPEHRAEVVRRLDDAYHAYRGEDIPYQRFIDPLKFSEEDLSLVNEYALSWSAEPAEVSLQAAMEDSASWEEYLDRNYQVVGGYSSLARKMAGPLGDRVRLSSPIIGIQWKRGKVKVTCRREGREERLQARRAIVTLPIGILQSGRPVFDPGLPGWKRQAVDSLHMGRVVVVHLLFDDWFWRQPPLPVPGWGAHQGRVSFYDPHPEGKGAPALQAWVTGISAQRLSDLGEKRGVDQVLGWIEEALPASNARKRLQWSAYRDWVRDPYALGSYSYTRPGGTTARSVLATPIDDTLFFAGEATQPAPHYQTVHGAYLSGRRAAREILASLGVEAPPVPGVAS